MPRELSVHLLPELCAPEALSGAVAVVLDVLRASTTIIHALAAGASAVYPCASVGDARRLAERLAEARVPSVASPHPGGTPSGEESPRAVLLGGERLGVAIEGFDLDNSPASYSPGRVAGRTIVFTTTNGTRAIERSRQAARILIGAFANRAALLDVLAEERRPIHFVCAGTDGQVTAEDVLAAGMLVTSLAERIGAAPRMAETAGGAPEAVLDEEACVAAAFFAAHPGESDRLRVLRGSRGGRDLIALGLGADIDLSARCDTCAVVPEYDPLAGALVPAGGGR